MQNFEKHELFCENMNFLTKFVNNWPNPSGNSTAADFDQSVYDKTHAWLGRILKTTDFI